MANKGDIRKSEIQPVFPKNWKAIPFKEGLDKGGKYPKLNSSAYLEIGVYPIIDQGEKFIAGYTNEEENLYDGELPVVIFGDHTRNIKFIDFEFAVGADGTKILKPKDEINPRFFFYYLKVLKIPSFGYSRHFKVFEYLDLPIPPLTEQQRIVAKLDAVFGHLDRVREKLDRIPELLKNFRQQVLTQAVMGELNRILFEFSELNEFGISIKTGPFGSALHKEEYITDGIPVINPSHILEGKIIPDPKITISIEKLQELRRWKLEDGDVLLGRRGEMGRAAKYSEKDQIMICGTGSIVLKPSKKIDPDFLSLYLRSEIVKNYLTNNSVGSTMINLNQKIIKSIPFPKIGLIQQREVIRHVENLFQKADKIESQYQRLKTKIDQMPQAVLAKAFRGELVGQEVKDYVREIGEVLMAAEGVELYKSK